MAPSTIEEEYVASFSDSCEVVCLQKLLYGLFHLELYAMCIFYENLICVKFLENPMLHDKSKHIEIKYHYIWDMVQRGC